MRKLLLLAVAALPLACGPDFDPYNRLTSLRVLAIQGEPPAPAPGETTTLTPLVFTPEPTTLTYAWSWCPFPGSATAGYPCRLTQDDLNALAGGAAPSLDLGSGPTAMLPNSVDPALLARLCAGEPGVPQLVDCEGGFPVQIKLTVATPDDEVTTVWTLRLRFDPATTPNTNPQIDGLAATLDGVDQPLGDMPTVTLPRRQDTVLKAAVAEADSEVYRGKDDEGVVRDDLRERLFLSWFIESGDSKDARTGFIAGQVPLERALMNKWKPDATKDYPRDTARLVVVIRDHRGGVGWRSAIVRLGDTP
jgi:hypothetical protein